MRKQQNSRLKPEQGFAATQLNTSSADRAAYEKYKRFCAGLGIEPASQKVYLGMNRRDVTHPNNIDVILLA